MKRESLQVVVLIWSNFYINTDTVPMMYVMTSSIALLNFARISVIITDIRNLIT